MPCQSYCNEPSLALQFEDIPVRDFSDMSELGNVNCAGFEAEAKTLPRENIKNLFWNFVNLQFTVTHKPEKEN